MNEAEYLEKCMSVADVLAKIIRGINVLPEERLKACKDAVEVFYYDKLQKKEVVKDKNLKDFIE